MRNLVFITNVSLDGCYDHTKFGGGSDEIYEYFIALMREWDLTVYGRKTYELMIPYWPDVAAALPESALEHEFARILTAMDKVVFSSTLQTTEANTQLVNADLETEIRKLKQQPGKKISLGGVNLSAQLVKLGLVDEFHLIVHPIVVGEGKNLWDDLNFPEYSKLKLVDAKVFKSGCVALHYVRE